MRMPWRYWCGAALLLAATANHAQQMCEVNGEAVDPSRNATMVGKTGIMRCRDRESGALLREETYRNGAPVGIARGWYASGQLRRVSFYQDDGLERAVAQFTAKGQLRELRCADRAMLAPHADDDAWCGHNGGASNVTLYRENGSVSAKSSYERGKRVQHETLWENGHPHQQLETTPAGGSERTFGANGVLRTEVAWIYRDTGNGVRQFTTFAHEYHENGKLVRERRYTPGENSAELQLETQWHLNGLPRLKVETGSVDGRRGQHELRYHDNGKVAFEGAYLLGERGGRVAYGVHKNFDIAGRLRSERYHDARGRIHRERDFDQSGEVTRDHELLEDGSRKPRSR